MNNWYIAKKNDKEIYGPFSASQIRQYLEQKKLQLDDFLSYDKQNWQKVREVFPPPDLKFQDYEILGELGRGGMGVVYKARHKSLNRYCAIKVLHSEDENSQKQFIKEAKAMARLDHPNIARIYDTGIHPMYFFAMEFIEGETLTKWMEYKPSTTRLLQIFRQICFAVEYAHKNKIIHRDLKPDNIMVKDDNVKVMDFGIARQLDTENTFYQTGEIVGTPHYIAPELLNGFKSDERSDIYALGVILYNLCTGRTPFEEGNMVQLLYVISTVDPPRPSEFRPRINKDLEVICMHCLQRNREARYQKVSLLRKEIERVLNNRPILTRPPSTLKKCVQWCYHHPLTSGLLMIIFVVIPLMTMWFLYKERQNKNELAVAHQQLQETLIKTHLETAKANITTKNYSNALMNAKKAYEISQRLEKKYYQNQIFFTLHTILPNAPRLEKEYRFVNFEKAMVSPRKQFFAGIYINEKKQPMFVCGKFDVQKRRYEFSDTLFAQKCRTYFIDIDETLQRAYFLDETKLHFYDFAKNEVVRLFDVDHEIEKIVHVPDGKKMIVDEGNTINIYSLPQKTLHFDIENVDGSFCVSRDGKFIAACVRNGIRIFDIDKKEESHLIVYMGHRFSDVAFGQQNRYLIAGNEFGKIFVCDLKRKKDFIFSQHKNKVTNIKFNNDLRIFASAGQDKNVMIWDASAKLISITKLPGVPFHLLFDRKDKLWVHSQSANGTLVQQWNISPYLHKKLMLNEKRKKLLFGVQKSHNVEMEKIFTRPLSISPKGNVVIQPFLIGSLVWDQDDRFRFVSAIRTISDLRFLRFSHDEEIVAKARNREVVFLNVGNFEITGSISFANNIKSIEFSQNRNTLFITDHREIFVYDYEKQSQVRYSIGNYGSLSSATPDPKDEWLAVGTSDGVVVLCRGDFMNQRPQVAFEEDLRSGEIINIKWHVSGKYFVCISREGVVTIFRLVENQWQKWKNYDVPQDIKNLSFSPDTKASYLAVFTEQDIIIFDLQRDFSGKIYDGYYKGNSANLFPDWSKIAIPSLNGNILIFDFPTDVFAEVRRK
ncbi:serine/threonine-protein kinase [Candidatus Uabimicrobium amorphum]|uniref:non-specific serine/threonine protein kinase n=1 Tax=Uabimicrobium amorphum TaxID=2596890 RepID=A0A5S9F5N0_UABAM|nr:serine/threonine-protein kinase [Candidatus Uabimicrobium amorphum]BBM86491.1 protein kinase [Candidatus Uabimicrobium amorphum]